MVYRELDLVRVKGKDKAVRIYEPVMPAEHVPQTLLNELESHEKALDWYRKGNWDKAEAQFISLQKMTNHPVYAIYITRIQAVRLAPPQDDWYGVHNFESK
jgi:adenylate cyclase